MKTSAFAADGATVNAPAMLARPLARAAKPKLPAAVSPRPVNVLVSRNTGLKVSDFAGMGVRRISVGSTLSRAAWSGFMNAAQPIAKDGSFSGFDAVSPFADINGFFREIH